MTPILLAIGAALAAPCETPTTTADVVEGLMRADAAFVGMDLGAFEAARQDAHDALRCLDEPLSAVDAAWLHRVEALAAFLTEDAPLARRAFQSSLSIQPAYRLPERIAPAGNPLAVLYEEAGALPASATEALPAPPSVDLFVDGARSEDRPVERPFVLQGIERRGAVQGTVWLAGADPLPGWAQAPLEPPPSLAKQRRRPHLPLLIAGGTALAAGGASYGAAWAYRGKYLDKATPMEDLEGLRARTNTATVVAGVLGGVGLGVTGTALVIPW